jgi:hypothetical protein
MGISPFGRGVNSEVNKKGFSGKFSKSGGKKFWFDKWRLPQGNPAPFVIVSGDYVDPNPSPDQIELDSVSGQPKPVKNTFFKLTKHKRKLLKNGKEEYRESICSEGHDPHNPQPCAGCMAQNTGDKSVSKTEQFLFTIVHLHPYHTHPLVDRETGGFVKKKAENGGGFVIIETECSGRICNFCAILKGKPVSDPAFPKFNQSDIGTILGKRRYLEVGKGHLSNLAGWDTSIRSQCGECKSVLDLMGYACGTCNSMTINAETDTRTDGELEDAVSRPYPCPSCKRATLHKEVVGCQVCESNGKVPTQHSLFGVVLWGSRQGEGTKSQLMLARFETLDEHNAKVPKQLLNGRTVAQIVEEVGKPYNFSEVMVPESVQEQAQRLDLNVNSFHLSEVAPFQAPVAQQPQFAPYPQSQGPQIAFMPPIIPTPFGNGTK